MKGRLGQGYPKKLFGNPVLHDSSFVDAKKIWGIVSVRIGEYDKAMSYVANQAIFPFMETPVSPVIPLF